MAKLSCFLVILGLYSLCTTTTLARPHRQGKQSGRDFLKFLIQQYSNYRSSKFPLYILHISYILWVFITVFIKCIITGADNLWAPKTQTPQEITPLQTTTLAASTTESITTEMAKSPNATTEGPTMTPGPCRSAGHTGCCAIKGPTDCFIESESCFCDHRCYREDNCCSDIRQICPCKYIFVTIIVARAEFL